MRREDGGVRLTHMARRQPGEQLGVDDGDLLLLGPKELLRQLRAPRDQVEGRLLLPMFCSSLPVELQEVSGSFVVKEAAVLRDAAVAARASRAAEAPRPSGTVVARSSGASSRASSIARKVAMTG